MFNRRRPATRELLLKRENDALALKLCRLQSELTSKQHYAERLEYLLHQRMERIDQLTAQVDQLRHQNKKLDAEAEHLAAIIAAPKLDAAVLTQKLDTTELANSVGSALRWMIGSQ